MKKKIIDERKNQKADFIFINDDFFIDLLSLHCSEKIEVLSLRRYRLLYLRDFDESCLSLPVGIGKVNKQDART